MIQAAIAKRLALHQTNSNALPRSAKVALNTSVRTNIKTVHANRRSVRREKTRSGVKIAVEITDVNAKG